MDIGFIKDAAVTVLATVVMPAIASCLFGYGLKLLQAHRVDTRWYEAVGRAGGVAFVQFAGSGRPVTDKTALTEAAAAGAAYLRSQMAGQIAKRKLSEASVQEIAGAEFGTLLPAAKPL